MKRRQFIKIAGALFLGTTAFLTLPYFKNSKAFNFRLSFKKWYIRTVEPKTPEISPDDYILEITGLVKKPARFTLKELLSLPQTSFTRTFNCVEGWSVPDVKWQGVSFRTIIDKVQPHSDARFINVYCHGGTYTESLWVQEALEPDNILALKTNGEFLSNKHGFPARVFMPRKYGYKSAKWVVKLEFSKLRIDGFWSLRGYDIDGDLNG